MDSRFNIPAPAMVKLTEDIWLEKSQPIESGGPARGCGGFGRSGFFKYCIEKIL